MAVLDIGAASQEQLQVVRQHPAMKGAFAVHVCRKATLTSALASLTEAAANAQVEKAVAHMQEQIAAGLVQVSLGLQQLWVNQSRICSHQAAGPSIQHQQVADRQQVTWPCTSFHC